MSSSPRELRVCFLALALCLGLAHSSWATDAAVLRTFKGHEEGISGIALSVDGKILVSAGKDKTIRIWDTATGKEKAVLKESADAVAISPDGTRIASGGWGTKIQLWDVASGKPAAALEGNKGAVRCLVFAPDGKSLISALDLSTVKIDDKGMKHLSGLVELRELSFSDVKITDAGMAHLKGLTKLDHLSLPGTGVTGAGLAHLKGAENLTWLYLASTHNRGTGIEHFPKVVRCSFRREK